MDDYKIIVEQEHQTVMAHYEVMPKAAEGYQSEAKLEQDLFDVDAEQIQKLKRLDAVVDRINKLNGSETIVIASQQYTKPGGKGRADVFSNAMKQDHKSKNPTTRWSDIIKLK